MTPRALTALVAARLYEQRRLVLYACAAALVVGLLQPREAGGPVMFCSFLGILMALAQSPGRYPHLDRCEQSAPLFGRELARAKALIPCVAAALATTIYAAAASVRGAPDAVLMLPIALAAVVAATLTALSATLRLRGSRAFYVLLAAAASAIAYVLAVPAHSPLAEFGFCAIASFLALRQYGEALARYDPI
ncbi:MAG: hypothetical protein JO003_07020 [Candidatus Eremiobacteraeota bacterium]|nr:hypothetical protein [Candidatus Eremiobacteraeota bacterium]